MKILFSLLITILTWVGILWFEEYKNPGPSNYFPQIVCCIWFLMNAYIGVNPYEEKEIHTRWGKLFTILSAGFYFYPFLWVWAIIYKAKKEEDNVNINLNFDQSKPLLKRDIGVWESLSREFLIPFIFRKGAWAIFVSFLFGSLLGFYSVKYKNKIFYGIQNDFDPIVYIFTKHNKNNNQNIAVVQTPQNKIQYQQVSPPTDSVKRYGSDTTRLILDSAKKVDNITNTIEDQNLYQPVVPVPDWLPPANSFNSGVTWGNLKPRDNWSIVSNMEVGMNYVNVSGYFASSYHSTYHYYPNIYVDGFNGDQKFFCHFFKVLVREMTFKNGQTWTNQLIDLCDYIEMIEEEQRVDKECYRDIKIYLKDEFKGKYSWHLVDAGWGDGKVDFKMFLYDQDRGYQAIISQNETARTGHKYHEHRPMTAEMDTKYLLKVSEDKTQNKTKDPRKAKTNIKRKKGEPIGSNY